MKRENAIALLEDDRSEELKQFSKKIVNKIYDDFESRTCNNCVYYNSMNESSGLCEHLGLPELGVDSDFGCNKWEAKR